MTDETTFAEAVSPQVQGPLGLMRDAILKLGALGVAALICIYLLPAMIAVHRPSAKAIAWFNVYFGWTGVVWMLLLIWAWLDCLVGPKTA